MRRSSKRLQTRRRSLKRSLRRNLRKSGGAAARRSIAQDHKEYGTHTVSGIPKRMDRNTQYYDFYRRNQHADTMKRAAAAHAEADRLLAEKQEREVRSGEMGIAPAVRAYAGDAGKVAKPRRR